jgi:hypothetical protein
LKARGIIGRRVVWRGACGEWRVRAVVGRQLRIRRDYGSMSFVVDRRTVRFVRRHNARPMTDAELRQHEIEKKIRGRKSS